MTEPVKLASLIAEAESSFAEAGIDTPRQDAEILLAHLLGIGRGELAVALAMGETAPADTANRFEALAKRRAAREPLQHLTGIAYFRNIELQVGPGVFVPRPETELAAGLAIEAAARWLDEDPQPIVVDLATGSGAIALSVATECPEASVFAIELSPDAHAWATKNFERLAPGATLAQGDLREAFPELAGRVAVLVSNPPYIPDAAIPIYPEVHLHDPSLALYGGDDGLDLVRAVIECARLLLRPGGTLIIEHADTQGRAITDLLLAGGWSDVRSHLDLNQRDRVATAVR